MRFLLLLVLASPETRLEQTVRKLASFPTRHTASEEIHASRKWLVGEFRKIEGLHVAEQAFRSAKTRRLAAGVELVNVVATVKGTAAPDRIYIVSGHYDSRASDVMDAKARAPGANDDASGVAVVLELARRFAEKPTEATVLFLCVAGEEQGLLGARHFARDARERKLRIEGMITNDIVGNTRGADGKVRRDYVRVFSEGMPAAGNPMDARLRRSLGSEWDSPSRQLARYVREQARGLKVKMVFRPDRFLRGGDHMAFLEVGYPAVRLTEPAEDYTRQHQDVREGFGDLPGHVDYAYLAAVAQVNETVLRALANAPAAPRGARIHIHRLESSTTLSWTASPEPDVSHYEVVWRDTTAADWEHSRRVDATRVTLPRSKDDWHFGVRVVDKDGHKSPVSYPRPTRDAPK